MEGIADLRAAEEPPEAGPVLTAYEEIVAGIIASVKDGVAQLPGYDDDLSDLPRNQRRLVTRKFVELTMNAVDASSELLGVDQLEITQCRDTLQYSEAVRALIAHLNGVTRRLELISRSREARVGRSALRIYHIAKRLASDDPNNTHIAVHVQNLKAEMQRSRLKRRAKAASQATATAEDVLSTSMG